MTHISANHESKSSKNREIKNCRNRVIQMMEQYRRPPEEKNPDHSGPLCFLPRLFTSFIAVSGKSRKRWHGFQTFVEETILENDDEVLSFFDDDKNMEAFRKENILGLGSCKYYQCDGSFVYPPVLLLSKANQVQERCFLDYVEKTDVNDQSASRYKLSDKGTAYQNWLFSLAFYEICVLDYYGRFKPDEIPLCWNEFIVTDGSGNETVRKLLEGVNKINTGSNKLLETLCSMSFLCFLMKHITSLFAALRVQLLIEFCNIGCAENIGEDFRSRNELYRKVRKKATSLNQVITDLDMKDKDQGKMGSYLHEFITVFENTDRKERKEELQLSNIIMPPDKWLRGYEIPVKYLLNITFDMHPSYFEEKNLDKPSDEDIRLLANLWQYIRILQIKAESGLSGREAEEKLDEFMLRVRNYLAKPLWEYLIAMNEVE